MVLTNTFLVFEFIDMSHEIFQVHIKLIVCIIKWYNKGYYNCSKNCMKRLENCIQLTTVAFDTNIIIDSYNIINNSTWKVLFLTPF